MQVTVINGQCLFDTVINVIRNNNNNNNTKFIKRHNSVRWLQRCWNQHYPNVTTLSVIVGQMYLFFLSLCYVTDLIASAGEHSRLKVDFFQNEKLDVSTADGDCRLNNIQVCICSLLAISLKISFTLWCINGQHNLTFLHVLELVIMSSQSHFSWSLLILCLSDFLCIAFL